MANQTLLLALNGGNQISCLSSMMLKAKLGPLAQMNADQICLLEEGNLNLLLLSI